MFHIHNWIKFKATLESGIADRFRKCTKCNKIEMVAGDGIYGGEWISTSLEQYNKENQKIIRNEINKEIW